MTTTETQPSEAVTGELLADTPTLLHIARDYLHEAEGHGSKLVVSLWLAGRTLRDAKAQALREGEHWGALLDAWGIDNRRASEAMRVSELPEADLPKLATVRLALQAAKTDRRVTTAAVPDEPEAPEPEPKLTRAEEAAQEREAELAEKRQLVDRLTDRVGSLEAENRHLRETNPAEGKAQGTSIVEQLREEVRALTHSNAQLADECAELKARNAKQRSMLSRKDREIAALRERAEAAEAKPGRPSLGTADGTGTGEHVEPDGNPWGVAQP